MFRHAVHMTVTVVIVSEKVKLFQAFNASEKTEKHHGNAAMCFSYMPGGSGVLHNITWFFSKNYFIFKIVTLYNANGKRSHPVADETIFKSFIVNSC